MKEGWCIKKMQELCEKITDGTHQTPKYFDEGVVFLSSKNVTSGKIDWDNVKYLDEAQHKELQKRVAPKIGDILLAKNGTTGVAAIVDRDVVFDIYVSLAWLRSLGEVAPEYLWYYINSPLAKKQFNSRLKGIGVPNLHLKEIKEVSVPVPPLQEQQKIVEKLDKAFELIDQAKANIEQNIINAKELFQSKLDEVMNVKIDGWKSDNLVDITSILGDGLHGTPKYSDDGDYYFVNGNNLSDKGIVIKENTKRVSEDEFYKYRKELNDRTIFVSINGTLGNVSFYNNEKIILGKSACYFNVLDGFDKEFLMYHFKAPRFIKYAHKEATGATIKNVSLKSMRNFVVHYPDLQKQKIIVKYLNNVKIYTDNLLNDYQQKLSNLEELRKSILEKAFKGELTH